MRTPRSEAAFTLFEVAISMLLVAVGVVSVVLLMIQGVKSQQLARYQLFASAVALEIIDAYNQRPTNYWGNRVEGKTLVDVQFNRCTTAPDLERSSISYAGNVFPLPHEISRRLDSEGDEIRQLLDDGGVLMYFGPKTGSGTEADAFTINGQQLQVGQRVIFGVSGYAQQNSLLYHPMIGWPYYMQYPSPPGIDNWRGQGYADANMAAATPASALFDAWDGQIFIGTAFEGAYKAMRSSCHGSVGGSNFHTNVGSSAAAFYSNAKTLWSNVHGLAYIPTADPNDGRTPPATPWGSDPSPLALAQKVVSWSYLAHATMVHYSGPGMDVGNCLGAITSSGGTFALNTTANGIAQALEMRINHRAALAWIMKWQAERPYDWRVQRPINRQLFLDFPLFQYDLFTPYDDQGVGGFYPGIGGQVWRSWKVVGPSEFNSPAIRSLQGLIDRPQFDPQADWQGDPANFNLTKPFIAAHRCRQLVFWAVDWQAYEDFEELPSAPLDSSRLITFPSRSGTVPTNNNPVLGFEWNAHETDDFKCLNRFRNPELLLLFKEAARTTKPGSRIGDPTYGRIFAWPSYLNATGASNLNSTKAELGLFGADRNGNGKFDRGPVPASTRLRAQTVGRFNFYDKRLPCSIRQ